MAEESLLTQSQFLFYQMEDGQQGIQVRLENETAWLSQKLMSELFQKDVRTINEHIKNIYSEKELPEESTIRKFRIVQIEGSREVSREIEFYNLEVIIAVGYRVSSHRGTQFRQWATERLKEYIVKGFTLDDERLKQGGEGSYFDELLARIRDIRSSEKIFWRKVLDIYATSVDYDPKVAISKEFFFIIQNKMHWAAHGYTAAEIIYGRVDAMKLNVGMTNFVGAVPRKADVSIAKNYLNENELEILNRIVNSYLEFAELQALNRNPMYMKDWITKLDDFLKLAGRDVLNTAGKISHELALEKAHGEYEKYRKEQLNAPTPVEKHFIEVEQKIKRLEKTVKRKSKS